MPDTPGTPADWRERTRQSRPRTFIVMGLTAVVILAVAYMVNRPSASGQGLTAVTLSGPTKGDPPKIGRQAPDFTARTVDGRTVTLSAFKGRPVWLSFGASWCQPCRAENPDIEAAFEKNRSKRLVVLQVFISEDVSTVRDYATRIGLTYDKIADPATTIASAYRVLGIPSHFFIDPSGTLRVMKVGTLNPEAIDKTLEEVSR
jgi:cytochrome c biogenesis protein CcmG/thiol:disulfide interchange protein DsbE